MDKNDYQSDLNVVFETNGEHELQSALPRRLEETKDPETDYSNMHIEDYR